MKEGGIVKVRARAKNEMKSERWTNGTGGEVGGVQDPPIILLKDRPTGSPGVNDLLLPSNYGSVSLYFDSINRTIAKLAATFPDLLTEAALVRWYRYLDETPREPKLEHLVEPFALSMQDISRVTQLQTLRRRQRHTKERRGRQRGGD